MKHTNLKIRVLAGILTLTTALSVGTVAVVPAAAATAQENTESVITNVAMKGLETTIDVLTEGNPVAKVLGNMGFSAFSSLIGLQQEDPNQEVLDSISELSDNLDAYHKEEMDSLNRLSGQLQTTFEKLDKHLDEIDERFETSDRKNLEYFKKLELTNFKARVDSAKVHFSPWFACLESVSPYLGNENDFDENGRLNPDVYRAFKRQLSDDRGKELQEDLGYLSQYVSGNSLELDGRNAYCMLTDLAVISELGGFDYDNDAAQAAYLNDAKIMQDGIQAEITSDYAAYLTYLQMKYQCEISEADGDQEEIVQIDKDYASQLAILKRDMAAAQKGYEDGCSYYNSRVGASVELTVQGKTTSKIYYFASVPVAWAATTQTADSRSAHFVYGGTVVMTLYKDWVDSGKGMKGNLPVPRNNHPAFAVSSAENNNNLPSFYPTDTGRHNSIILELNGHKMTVKAGALSADMHQYRKTRVHGFESYDVWVASDEGLYAPGIIYGGPTRGANLSENVVRITNYGSSASSLKATFCGDKPWHYQAQ